MADNLGFPAFPDDNGFQIEPPEEKKRSPPQRAFSTDTGLEGMRPVEGPESPGAKQRLKRRPIRKAPSNNNEDEDADVERSAPGRAKSMTASEFKDFLLQDKMAQEEKKARAATPSAPRRSEGNEGPSSPLAVEVEKRRSFVSADRDKERAVRGRQIMQPITQQQRAKTPKKERSQMQMAPLTTARTPSRKRPTNEETSEAPSEDLAAFFQIQKKPDDDEEFQVRGPQQLRRSEHQPRNFDDTEFSVASQQRRQQLQNSLHRKRHQQSKESREDEKSVSTSSTTHSGYGDDEDYDGDCVQDLAAQYAAVASRKFDAFFALKKNPEKAKSVCLFHGQEIVLENAEQPIRQLGHFVEYQIGFLQTDLMVKGQFGSDMQNARERFVERCTDGTYCVKFIEPTLLLDSETGPALAADVALEVRILQNLPGHPNISPMSGTSQATLMEALKKHAYDKQEADCLNMKNGFFMITERIQELLSERMEAWNNKKGYSDGDRSKISQRLEVALDISSALMFLHDREIVYHPRPDKIGFDAKHSCLKLFSFSEARQDEMKAQDQSPFVAKSDSISTLAYCSPEILCNAPVTISSDVFGFGILLHQIVSLKTPFEGWDRAQYFGRVVKNHYRPRISSKWPSEIGKLLEGCWDPHMRITMKKANEELESILLF